MKLAEVECFLGERRERRVAADDADDEADPQPRRQMMPVDERGGDDADQEAAGDVDRERAHREDGGARALDQAVDAVPGRGSECAAECDADDDGHA